MSRITSLESQMNQILTMLARLSTTAASNAKLRRHLTKLEHQLTIVVEQRKLLQQQQQQLLEGTRLRVRAHADDRSGYAI